MHELEQRLIEAQNQIQKLCYKLCDSILPGDRSNKREYRNRLYRKLGFRLDYCDGWADIHRYELKRLNICLDKLQLANNLSRSRCFKLSSSVKEVDHHSLHFGMLHGIKNLSEEKKIAQKLKKIEKDTSAQFLEDCKKTSYTQYPVEIMKLKQQTDEEAIQSCVVSGNKWISLGTKQYILQNIKSLSEQYGNEDDAVLLKRNLTALEKELRCFDKQWSELLQLIRDASNCIIQLRNQNQNIIKAKETQLLNKTLNFINAVKERPVSLKNMRKTLEKLQQDA